MAEPFLSEIRIFSFQFAPKGWALCNGQFLAISQNQALFSLLGTTYGGNGQTTFALPNLQGRVPLHQGDALTMGQAAGTSTVTITQPTMPAHPHVINASSTDGNASAPTNHILAREVGNPYRPPADGDLIALNPAMITNTGGSQPHENMMPYLTLNFCIALSGIFPSQN